MNALTHIQAAHKTIKLDNKNAQAQLRRKCRAIAKLGYVGADKAMTDTIIYLLTITGCAIRLPGYRVSADGDTVRR